MWVLTVDVEWPCGRGWVSSAGHEDDHLSALLKQCLICMHVTQRLELSNKGVSYRYFGELEACFCQFSHWWAEMFYSAFRFSKLFQWRKFKFSHHYSSLKVKFALVYRNGCSTDGVGGIILGSGNPGSNWGISSNLQHFPYKSIKSIMVALGQTTDRRVHSGGCPLICKCI